MAAALCVIGHCDIRLWSHTPAERLRLQFAKAGVRGAVDADAARLSVGSVIVARADAVLDQPLIAVLRDQPGLVLTDGRRALAAHAQPHTIDAAMKVLGGEAPVDDSVGLTARQPHELDASFWKALRKRETPYALAVDAANRADVEWRMFMGTYKGATDVVTKHLWPVPAFHLTRWLAERRVTPNAVTVVATALTVAAFFLFLYGHFAAGLAAAWLMTFLDTVDGKLARTTLTTSRWGDVLDHGVDLVSPPFWYVAWAYGLPVPWSDGVFWAVMAAVLGGYVAQRVMEGIAIAWMRLEIHIWRPIDTLFRQVTARRNPNLVILTAAVLIGRPDIGLIAVAAWTVVCLALHGVQLIQAVAARRRGPLQSWMTTG